MEPQHPQENQSARVLALGGLAAGTLGSLYVLFSERERKPKSKLEQARHALEDAASQTRERAMTLESELASQLDGARGRSAKKGKQARKDARKAGMRARKQSRRQADDAREKVVSTMLGAKEKRAKRLQEIEKQAPDVAALAQQFLSRTESSLGKAKESGVKGAQKARKDAEKAQLDMRQRVERVREEAPKRLHDVEAIVTPKVKDLEKQAASVLGAGKERAAELRERAEKDLLPEVKQSADKVRGRVGEQAKVAAAKIEHGSSDAVNRLSDATGAVESHAKDAGAAVAQGGRDVRSLVVWLAFGGALVYAAFLNDAQREKVKAWANRLMDEAAATYGDIKGQDGTFGTA